MPPAKDDVAKQASQAPQASQASQGAAQQTQQSQQAQQVRSKPPTAGQQAQQQQQQQPQAQQQQQQQRPPNQQQGQQQRSGGQPQYSQADLNKIVLEYLNKKGYHQTEATLRLESTKIPGGPTVPVNPSSTNFSKPQAPVTNRTNLQYQQQKYIQQQQTSKLRQFDEDPAIFGRAYLMFKNWCETSLEMYKYELEKFLFPIFVHLYLTLISRDQPKEAREFYENFHKDHIILHNYEVMKLGGISLKSHLEENEVAKIFRDTKYRIIASNTSVNLILGFLNENEGIGGGLLVREINAHIQIIKATDISSSEKSSESDGREGIPAIYELIYKEDKDSTKDGKKKNVKDVSNLADGENLEAFNSKPVKLGKLPQDPEFTKELEAELQQRDELANENNQSNGKSKPEKTLMEEYNENFKVDPNSDDSPSRDILPLPQKTAYDLRREISKIQDSRAKIKLDTNSVQASLPSVCMYTFHNTNNDLTCLEFNDDSTIVAGGFQDSFIKLWSIDGSPLKSVLKNDEYNQTIDGMAVNGCRKLVGHSGAVYGLDFSPENNYLLSSSEDKTVRLWSMDTYTSLVSYKGHNSAVWDVKFSPMGHYFATASHDQTARLWSCDHIYPLRIFAGHLNDVDVVEFHPNSTYLFTGSSDKTIRMWDIARGESVRVFLGHSMPINCLAVSPDGRWLASGGEDSTIQVYDIASGRRFKTMIGHGRCSIYSLSFSRDGSVLVSSGSDNSVRIWDIKKGSVDNNSNNQPEKFTVESVLSSRNKDELNNESNSNVNGSNSSNVKPGSNQSNNNNNNTNNGSNSTTKQDEATKRRRQVVASQDHMAVYFTKKTPVYKVHFTRRNLCLAGGVFTG